MDKKLIDFIAESKKQAYASDKIKPKKTKDGGKSYSIKKGDFLYTDTYFGNIIDCGQERVYYKGKVRWVMAYRGGIYDKYQLLHEKAFEFLKKCISNIPKNFPARGPKSMRWGNFRYENKWEGNIKGFVGKEEIYYQGKKICFRNYLGGLIKNHA
jgi:hypothetical protein